MSGISYSPGLISSLQESVPSVALEETPRENGRLNEGWPFTDEYRVHVKRVAEEANGKDVIENRTVEHAGFVISALLDKAERQVLILCGELDDAAYANPEVIASAINYLKNRNGKMDIIIETKLTYSKTKFLSALRNADLIDRIAIYLAPADLVPQYPFHFMVADDSNYRFQFDKSKPKYEAIAQFGVRDTNSFKQAFEKIRRQSTLFPMA